MAKNVGWRDILDSGISPIRTAANLKGRNIDMDEYIRESKIIGHALGRDIVF